MDSSTNSTEPAYNNSDVEDNRDINLAFERVVCDGIHRAREVFGTNYEMARLIAGVAALTARQRALLAENALLREEKAALSKALADIDSRVNEVRDTLST